MADKKKKKQKATPLKDVPIEILLNDKTSIFGHTDKEKKKEILREMGIIQIAKGASNMFPKKYGAVNNLKKPT